MSQWLTCSSPAAHLRLTCSSPAAHLQLTCSPPAALLQLTCSSPAAHLQLTCSSPEAHLQLSFSSSAAHLQLTCSSSAAHLQPTCSSPAAHLQVRMLKRSSNSCVHASSRCHPAAVNWLRPGAISWAWCGYLTVSLSSLAGRAGKLGSLDFAVTYSPLSGAHCCHARSSAAWPAGVFAGGEEICGAASSTCRRGGVEEASRAAARRPAGVGMGWGWGFVEGENGGWWW